MANTGNLDALRAAPDYMVTDGEEEKYGRPTQTRYIANRVRAFGRFWKRERYFIDQGRDISTSSWIECRHPVPNRGQVWSLKGTETSFEGKREDVGSIVNCRVTVRGKAATVEFWQSYPTFSPKGAFDAVIRDGIDIRAAIDAWGAGGGLSLGGRVDE